MSGRATPHLATCRCGQLQVACEADPVRVSVCHCRDCQRRSGSAFAVQARFLADRVRFSGDAQVWTAGGENGRTAFRFCPVCGSTVAFVSDAQPELIAIAVGAFADSAFPPPTASGFEEYRHPWVRVDGPGIAHFD